jgi:peptidoglycan/LPS O-acetylase OafA/YrhL
MKPAHQINALPTLRGLAALAVLLWHCQITSRTSYFRETTVVPHLSAGSSLEDPGSLYFFLSSVTLYISYGASVLTDARKFILRRVGRIYPAFVVGWCRLGFIYAICVPFAYVLACCFHVLVKKPGIEFVRSLQLDPKGEVANTAASD